MKMYTIKVAVRGVSPMVWRQFRIAADTSLAALHYIIQIAQGWGDDHLHQFHIYGKNYGISYEGGIVGAGCQKRMLPLNYQTHEPSVNPFTTLSFINRLSLRIISSYYFWT
ncbi:MAG: plasmid pRiA4b ORF-3 family protein [Citrobacter sp.]|nr:plasmid pRiA4b ORF-3 family protein [Citrobacter sp.]